MFSHTRKIQRLLRKRNIKGLIKCLHVYYYEDKEEARKALIAAGHASVKPLIDTLRNDKDAHYRAEAAWILGKINDNEALEPLIQALDDNEYDVSDAAAYALGALKDPQAVGPLFKALERGRFIAFGALKKIGYSGLVADTIGLAEKLQENLSRDIIEFLGESGDVRAVQPLICVLKRGFHDTKALDALRKLGWKPETDSDKAFYWIYTEQWTNLVNLGNNAVEPLIYVLGKWGPSQRTVCIVEALGAFGDSRAIRPLVLQMLEWEKYSRGFAYCPPTDTSGELALNYYHAIDAAAHTLRKLTGMGYSTASEWHNWLQQQNAYKQ